MNGLRMTPEAFTAHQKRLGRVILRPRGTVNPNQQPVAGGVLPKSVRPSKHGNRKTVCNGEIFDSAKEARRWQALQLMEKAGEIADLRRQVRLQCRASGEKVCAYVADFCYFDFKPGEWVLEDVKSDHTRKLPTYRLKKKLIKACYGVDILET